MTKIKRITELFFQDVPMKKFCQFGQYKKCMYAFACTKKKEKKNSWNYTWNKINTKVRNPKFVSHDFSAKNDVKSIINRFRFDKISVKSTVSLMNHSHSISVNYFPEMFFKWKKSLLFHSTYTVNQFHKTIEWLIDYWKKKFREINFSIFVFLHWACIFPISDLSKTVSICGPIYYICFIAATWIGRQSSIWRNFWISNIYSKNWKLL